ncbi:hypothetical protein [uncultured Algibacter sp.]|uniref:tetratricopeptide repeat protein n=1 Tax=uncultured Algibacter sp. TaxID=298659 RepID=UPI00261E4BF6|nr:hypothetical protein [uncultured Algibacter sp.]
MNFMILSRYIILLFILIHYTDALAQSSPKKEIELITHLIEQDSIDTAESIIIKNIEKLKVSKKNNELTAYIFPYGKIYIIKNDFKKAQFIAKNLLNFIETHVSNPETRYLANLEFSKLCLDFGELPLAYEYGKKAKEYAIKSKNTDHLINCEYYLADYGMKLGQINWLEKHVKKADSIVNTNPNKTFKITARVYNLYGALMFFTSKQDSALYYFNKALKHIPNLEQNEENRYYLPSAIKGNMSIIKLNQGKPSQAKPLIQSSIKLAKQFLNSTTNHPLENRVKRNLMIGYNTLNGLHYDLGDYEKSDIITKLAYNYTKANFPENSQEFFMAALTHAEVKMQKYDLDEALKYLDIAKNSLKNINGENFQLKAFLNEEYANVFNLKNDYEKSLKYRVQSNIYYEKSNPNAYDSNKMYHALNLAEEYSRINDKDKAIKTIQNVYDYFYKTKGEKDFFINALMLTFAKVYYNLGMYTESLNWSEKSIALYNKNKKTKSLDKIYFDEGKAGIYIVNAQSKYHRTKTRDTLFLKSLLSNINIAIKTIEERKTSIVSYSDLSTLIESNTKVFDFAKKIHLELFKKTKNTLYLDRLISLHESALYNRIRARLNTRPQYHIL